jgi:hypothetical protein
MAVTSRAARWSARSTVAATYALRRSTFWICAAGALIVGGVLHFVALASSPPGLYADEAGVGYSAWSVSVDGHDEHGVAWPMYFESFGDWKNPLTIYLVAGTFRLFGPSTELLRGVTSSLALLTAILLAVLAWQLTENRWLALATLLVMSVLPWLFVLGRIAFEVSAQPACIAAFLVLWRVGRWWTSVLAGIALGLSAYAYSTGRLLIVLVVVALAVVYLGDRRLWQALIAGLCAIEAWLPAAIWASNSPAFGARLQYVSIFALPGNPFEHLRDIVTVYASDWSPTFLFYSGDAYGRHASGHGGVLFAALAPLLAIGLYAIWRRRADRFVVLIAAGLLVAPIPAALTSQYSHSLRDAAVVPFLAATMILGADELWRGLAGSPARRFLVSGLIAVLAVEVVSFQTDYFTAYPQRQYWWFETGFSQALSAAEARPHGTIYLSDHIEQAPILFAWFAREDPRVYRAQGTGAAGAEVVDLSTVHAQPGDILIAPDGLAVPHAVLIEKISLPTSNEWGKPGARAVFDLYRPQT